eukprot:m.168375 g.168375  ORF g.168375 m.168375 type:complete len:407 (-) comp14747_c0_seq3:115-1335(-)
MSKIVGVFNNWRILGRFSMPLSVEQHVMSACRLAKEFLFRKLTLPILHGNSFRLPQTLTKTHTLCPFLSTSSKVPRQKRFNRHNTQNTQRMGKGLLLRKATLKDWHDCLFSKDTLRRTTLSVQATCRSAHIEKSSHLLSQTNPTYGGTTTYISRGKQLTGKLLLSMADKMKSKRKGSKDTSGEGVPKNAKDPTFNELVVLLKRVRKMLADVLEKSATSVASNKLLEHIAHKRPTSLAELQRIEGFGSQRDKRFEWFASAVRHVNDGKDPSSFDPLMDDTPSQMQSDRPDGFGFTGRPGPPALAKFQHSGDTNRKRVQSSASPYFGGSTSVGVRPILQQSAERKQPAAKTVTSTTQRPEPPNTTTGEPKRANRSGLSLAFNGTSAASALSDPARQKKRKAPKNSGVF